MNYRENNRMGIRNMMLLLMVLLLGCIANGCKEADSNTTAIIAPAISEGEGQSENISVPHVQLHIVPDRNKEHKETVRKAMRPYEDPELLLKYKGRMKLSTKAQATDRMYNVLLIGADRRDESWNGNSDAMILTTINYTRETVMMTSFMRDTRVNVPGYGQRKLNSAFAIGGADLLVQTLTSNFEVPIDNYVWIDFDGLMEMVDALGGIDIVLTPAEAQFIGLSLPETALVHLNGEQTLLHARDRFSFGNDYERTQRQRDILNAILTKLRSGGLGTAANAFAAVLPYLHHNMSIGTIAGLSLNLPSIMNYQNLEQRVPYDGMYSFAGYDLVPNMEATKAVLRQTIFYNKVPLKTTYFGAQKAVS